MANLFLYSTLVALQSSVLLPSPALSSNVLLAKKDKKPPAAVVTEVEILKENFADTWFYTLRGSLKNQSDASILTPLVYYEIYSEETDKIIEAGTAEIKPKILTAGTAGSFQKELNTTGKIRITLVQWQQVDKAIKSHKQMQFFPLETEDSTEEEAGNPSSP
ncbi:hypothetical protein [Acaryochloris sp. CCMEE 5410]|uniref:hypothetical protein n=1 Tax=Acaryochloris sp. CCMEE 5410 TaxID=310037 RepID=UPI0002484E75|nr:hypothetical protein [Acaryochloris sp. CCMEE 5410]KAI9130392.1 hypothetical protein ON05_021400 [Acaryochloris sp. CCMEE 5410]